MSIAVKYGILIWGQACKTYLEKIHKLQKWVLRIISNSHYRSNSTPFFHKYNILNVYDMYKLEVGVFIDCHFANAIPESLNTFFTKRSNIHDYYTINNCNLNQT